MSFKAMILILFNLSLVPVRSWSGLEGFLDVKYEGSWRRDMGVAKVIVIDYYSCRDDQVDLGKFADTGCGFWFSLQSCRACAPISEMPKITGPHSSCWFDEKSKRLEGRNRAGICDEL